MGSFVVNAFGVSIVISPALSRCIYPHDAFNELKTQMLDEK